MWIHEGFTAYSENLYLNYHFSDVAASEYVIGTRKVIQNDQPLIGTYGVNKRGSNDMYYKGANMLHTLRQLLEDDKKWRSILQGLNKEFYHQTITSKQLEDYISVESGIDLTEFWQQYLRTILVPKLEYKTEDNKLIFRYVDIVDNFDMPLLIIVDGEEEWIFPTSEWKTKEFSNMIQKATVKADFYVYSEKVN
jgi:aminopeptidase N